MRRALSGIAIVLALGCGSSGEEAPPTSAPAPSAPSAPAATTPTPTPPPSAPTPTAAASDEVCAAVIVVAWQGAAHAPETITRTETEARARAEELRARVERGEDFAAVARAESDAASSGPRGGLLGTYTREDWPAAHEPIREPIWALREGEVSEALHAPYGWVVARRCAVEHVHTRHILVRYAGARNAGAEITRTREEAQALAQQIFAQVSAPGADFAAVARERSEDGSAERGGDLGVTGRGRLDAAYEQAAYGLAASAISPPVETDFGFHVIQRLE